ncbi:MAG: TIGR00341 family protein [Chlamydiae bacterium CG10_big_fil_rev_8_21_14_0_10_42_34]|nr:MAG: TIGR00341 family protein [Chlamydiae bacterium CG10_big_fil_rev_8_21_14_0_10_42_34]
MALRLIEIVLPEKDGEEIQNLIKDQNPIEHKQIKLPEEKVLVRILLDAQQNEAVLDLLEKRFSNQHDSRMVVLPVEATLPRPELNIEMSEKISREELYEDIKDAARCSRVYLIMIFLSTIVASVGLHQNNVAVIIGAMVMAPLLGPNVAMALGTTLGEASLIRQAFFTNLCGIFLVIAASAGFGTFINIDPTMTEIAARLQAQFGDIAIALAAGCAGSIAFTTGVSVMLIGVMVAVALLPPLVTFGLLLGGGDLLLARGALMLFLMNLICLNLAAVLTFWVQRIHPLVWWEKDRAKKATMVSIGILALMLAALLSLVFFFF